jgi:hypothetical protein
VQAAQILDTGFERPGDIQQSSITFRRWLDGIPDANPFCRAKDCRAVGTVFSSRC